MAWTATTTLVVVDFTILLLIGAAGFLVLKRRIFSTVRANNRAPRLLLGALLLASVFHFLELSFLLTQPGAAVSISSLPQGYLLLRWLLLLATAVVFCLGFVQTRRLLRDYLESLETSKTSYQRIVEDQTEMIVRWKPGGIRTWVNDAYCEFFRQPRERLIGTSFFSLIAEEDKQRIQAQLATLSPSSPFRTGVHQVLLPDGSRGWQEWTDRATFDESGSIIEIQSVGRDITARKQAELALAESEAQFRSLVENTADWVWEMNLDGLHTYSNRRVESILGYSTEEFAQITLLQLIHPDDVEQVQTRLPQLSAAKEGWRNWIMRLRHHNGTYRYLDSSASPLINAKGELTGFLGMDRDVTFQTLVSQASRRLIETEISYDILAEVLGGFGEYFDVHNMGCWWFTPDRDQALRSVRWTRPGIEILPPDSYRAQEVPWTARKLLAGEIVNIADVSKLPVDAKSDKETFSDYGMRSGLVVPISLGLERSLVGAGSASLTDRPRAWSEQEESELGLVFQIIAAAEARLQFEAELQANERFQSLLSGISKDLIEVRPESIGARIDSSLQRIADHYDLDRAVLWSFDETHKNLRCAYSYTDPVITTKFDQEFPSNRLPWAISKALDGETVRVASMQDIPADQISDIESLERLGIKSILTIPLLVENTNIGVGMFSTLQAHRDWPESTVNELTLLAVVLINAYARSRAMSVIHQREKDLSRSEALAKVGSYSFYPGISGGDLTVSRKALFSPEMAVLFDCEPEDASYELYVARLHSDDRARVVNATRDLIETGGSMNQRFRIVRPGGEVVYLQDHAEVLRDPQTGYLRIFGSVQDVTEQVLRERNLKEALGEIETLKDRLEEENLELRDEIKSAQRFDNIVGDSPALRRCLNLVSNVATTEATVLVLGETGTGKELVAHTIHDLSPRRNRRMISVNCAALPAELIESELFGHEKGAFTGAGSMRKGRFELAHDSTLFLDEIGEMPLALQSKLLRAIQEGEIERLGGSETLKVDVRLIVATNRNLAQQVQQGEFRADLFYRINTFPIEVPSLKERKDDIPLLVEHFVRKLAPGIGKEVTSISAGMIRYLKNRDWPGNIRELEGFIERALITNNGPVLVNSADSDPETQSTRSVKKDRTLRHVERSHILAVLDSTDWRITGEAGAAQVLGIPPSTLRSRMKKLGIERPDTPAAER